MAAVPRIEDEDDAADYAREEAEERAEDAKARRPKRIDAWHEEPETESDDDDDEEE